MKLFIFCLLSIILHSNNTFCQNWTYLTPSPSFNIQKLSGSDTIHLRALGVRNFHYSNDGGVTWTEVDFGRRLFDVECVTPQEGWVVAESGRLYHTADGGLTWDTTFIFTAPQYSKIQFFNAQKGYLVASVGNYDSLFITNDGGQTWTGSDISIPNVPIFSDSLRCWAFAWDTLYKSTNKGASWSYQILPARTAGHQSGLCFSDSLHGWITGIDSLMRTIDGGASWQTITPGRFSAIHFKDSLNGLMIGCYPDNAIYTTSDGGYTLNLLTPLFTLCDVADITIIQDRYYIFDDGNVITTDNSIDWNLFAHNQLPHNEFTNGFAFYHHPPKLEFSSAKNGIYISGDYILSSGDPFETWTYVTTDSAKSWNKLLEKYIFHVQTLSDSLWYFIQKPNNTAYLCKSNNQLDSIIGISQLNSANFFFTDSIHGVSGTEFTADGGQTWNQSTINGNPYDFGKTIFFSNNSLGWCSGGYNTLFRTTDGGVSWDSIYSFPTSAALRIQFTDSIHGLIELFSSYASGDLYQTNDGGNTWNLLTTPTYLYNFYALDSLRWWISGEKIFYTNDGGMTYQQQFDESIFQITFTDSLIGYGIGDDGLKGYFITTDQSSLFSHLQEDKPEDQNIKLFPNPSKSHITISSLSIIQQINVYDVAGRLLISQPVENASLFRMNVEELNEGIYMLIVRNIEQIQSLKFIKQSQ